MCSPILMEVSLSSQEEEVVTPQDLVTGALVAGALGQGAGGQAQGQAGGQGGQGQEEVLILGRGVESCLVLGVRILLYYFFKYSLFTLGDSCTCGQRVKATKIVNGVETEINEFPWQVGLTDAGWGYAAWCGGTLISDQWVLTAAHCTDGKFASDIELFVGEHDYSTESETNSLRMKVSEIINHWDYDSSTTNKDFALMKLESPINFADYPNIRPACLPQGDDNDYTGYSAIVSGWGTTSSGGDLSDYLQYVDVDVLANDVCMDEYGYGQGQITDQMLCANIQGGGKDSCQGDSGDK